MARLLDESWAKVDPVRAKELGYSGIIGYVSQDDTGKNITADQVAAAHKAGLDVGLVYEYYPSSPLGGSSAGWRDAGYAIDYMHHIGVPAHVAVYASIDIDVSASQLATVSRYVDAFAGRVRSAGYRVGAYSGYTTLAYLRAHGFTGYLWQTYAWSYGKWLPGVAVRQTLNGQHIAGGVADLDTTTWVDWGQWFAKSTPPASTRGDALISHWVTVRYGSRGQDVKNAEGLLLAHGLPIGCNPAAPDGVFGPTCRSSTMALQHRYGLKEDGVFGPATASVALYGTVVS